MDAADDALRREIERRFGRTLVACAIGGRFAYPLTLVIERYVDHRQHGERAGGRNARADATMRLLMRHRADDAVWA